MSPTKKQRGNSPVCPPEGRELLRTLGIEGSGWQQENCRIIAEALSKVWISRLKRGVLLAPRRLESQIVSPDRAPGVRSIQ